MANRPYEGKGRKSGGSGTFDPYIQKTPGTKTVIGGPNSRGTMRFNPNARLDPSQVRDRRDGSYDKKIADSQNVYNNWGKATTDRQHSGTKAQQQAVSNVQKKYSARNTRNGRTV